MVDVYARYFYDSIWAMFWPWITTGEWFLLHVSNVTDFNTQPLLLKTVSLCYKPVWSTYQNVAALKSLFWQVRQRAGVFLQVKPSLKSLNLLLKLTPLLATTFLHQLHYISEGNTVSFADKLFKT